MWSNYALALYRTLSRHRLYAALNVLGLALGIAVCLTLLLVVRFETSFDRWIPDAANIYRINQTRIEPGRPPLISGSTQPVLLPTLKVDFPQIRASARLMNSNYVVRTAGRQAYEDVVLADPGIFDVFRLPFVAGDPRTALSDTSSLVISQAMARKYFGADQALGRPLTLVIEGVARDYRVSGVLKDLPPNTHLKLDIIGRFDPALLKNEQKMLASWGLNFVLTYVRLHSPADAGAIQQGLPGFVDRHVGDDFPKPAHQYLKFHLTPLVDIHFDEARTGWSFRPGTDPLFVAALGIMGVAILLIAIINYISLATARSGMRAREVAVRKVVGATRRALIVQFAGEAIVMALAAGLIGAALAELALPGVRLILGEPVRVTYFGASGIVAPLIVGCLVVGLVSGLYPALVLSGFRPASVLASARSPGGGRMGARVRQGLTIFQFAVAITLMICTAVVFVQMSYLHHADIGFRRDGLLTVRDAGTPEAAPHMAAMMESIRHIPGVVSVAASDRRPAGDIMLATNMKRVDDPSVNPSLVMEWVSRDYFTTYGARMLAGRPLGTAFRLDDTFAHKNLAYDQQNQTNMVINASAVRALGYASPRAALGHKLTFGGRDDGRLEVGTIVGVAQDIRFGTPKRPADPQVYFEDTRLAAGGNGLPKAWNIAVRLNETNREAVTGQVEQIWREMVPGQPFRAESVASAMKPYYDPDARRGQLFAAGALLSGVIACLGLYGLAAFNTVRRFKEIGIRKTLGASTRDVMRLLIGEFLKPVILANLIAWPLAWFAMRAWLSGFDQRVALNPAYFVAPTLAAILVAVVTVADQAFRVARAEPAVALRYE
jgi:putative ABC transport system permease protein